MSEQTKAPFAKFFWQAEKDAAASADEGRPIFKKVEYVKITHPGRRDYELVTEATDEHKTRFARAYEAFKEAEEEPEDGTPLKMVPIFTVDVIEHLKLAGIKTLEKFVSLTDQEIQAFPSSVSDLKKPAMAYLEAANDKGALAQKFAKSEEIRQALEDEIQTLKESLKKADGEIQTLKDLLAKGSASTPKRKTLSVRSA